MNLKKVLLWLCLTFIIIIPSQVSAKECIYKFDEISEERTYNQPSEKSGESCSNAMYLCDDLLVEQPTAGSTCYKGNYVYKYNENEWNLCTGDSNTAKNARKVFKLIGRILQVAFIAIPIILIVMGSIDLMKAVVASKEDEMKKAQSTFIKRCLAAVIVFFVPLITSILLKTILETKESSCLTCVLNPDTCNID